ncbi:class I SAM-dependent methyltransferase, partial [Methylosinus sp. R-45379]|uniref:class I SAM-dependent methyltransferase n=1 Tax=Methylosinus sp. R-45379 TaxID=980563 RepID=UPI000A762908
GRGGLTPVWRAPITLVECNRQSTRAASMEKSISYNETNKSIFTAGDDFDRAATIEFIKRADLDDLRNPLFLENIVIPNIGLDRFISQHYPENIRKYCGKNFMACQMPIQLSKYLAYLSGKKINSYLEIGVAMGGTFVLTVEYLKRFNGEIDAMIIDMNPPGEHLDWYSENGGSFRYLVANTTEPKAANAVMSRKWDLVLIDADHTEEGCWRDYLMAKEFARLIAFHDVVNDLTPGVAAVWKRLKEVLPTSRYRGVYRAIPGLHKNCRILENNGARRHFAQLNR